MSDRPEETPRVSIVRADFSIGILYFNKIWLTIYTRICVGALLCVFMLKYAMHSDWSLHGPHMGMCVHVDSTRTPDLDSESSKVYTCGCTCG